MTAERYSLDSWLEYHPSDDNMDREERSRRFLAHRSGGTLLVAGLQAPPEHRLVTLAGTLGVFPDWHSTGRAPMRAASPAAVGAALMTGADWEFGPARRGGEGRAARPAASGPGLELVAREVIQNALDATPTPDHPVEVTLRLVRLVGPDKQAFLRALRGDALRPHVKAAAAAGPGPGNRLMDGLRHMDGEDLLLLVVEERGTVGLTGPERGPGRFRSLCRNSLGGCGGGAAARSRSALWAASRVGTVLFGSHLREPVDGRAAYRIFGRGELPRHESDGAAYAGTGWFGRRGPDGTGTESSWGDAELARALQLDRRECGTTICVVGVFDPRSDRDRPLGDLLHELGRGVEWHLARPGTASRLGVWLKIQDRPRR